MNNLNSLNESLNQRLQAKYPHLELAVLPLSQVNKDNESKRIDSEYFKKEYLENEKIISKFEYQTLEQLSTRITNGHTPYGENLLDNEIKFITAEFIDDFCINEVKKYISFQNHQNYLKRSMLNDGDIIFSIKGKVGNAVPIFDIKEPLNINQDVAKISIKKEINHFYVSAFLNSRYGKKQTESQATGQINPFIALGVLKHFKIPILPKDFQLEIEKLVKDSHKALEDSKTLYKEAESLLYESLGLDSTNPLESLMRNTNTTSCHTECSEVSKNTNADLVDTSAFSKPQYDKILKSRIDENSPSLSTSGLHSLSPSLAEGALAWVNTRNDDITTKYPHLNISIRTLSQSYGKSGRLDSEYYQSKYDAIERKIKDYKSGYCKLESSEIKDTNFIPKTQEKYRYIELANIGNNGNISEPLEDLGENLPTRARRKVKTRDFIMSSIEGSLASCAIITPDFNDCLVSTGFYVLNSTKLNSETLLVLFKSAFFQEYLKKFPSGTILTAISKDELQNVLIPKIDSTTQEQIASKIQKSFALRKVAKDLLESAKSKVEHAIEQGTR